MIKRRTNYYTNLIADYSKAGLVSEQIKESLVDKSEEYALLQESVLPLLFSEEDKEKIEKENKDWWPTHCESLRQGRGDLLTDEYRRDLVYFCQDGPFYGRTAGVERELNWWAIIAQPGVSMVWPIVMFEGDAVYFEWKCLDDETNGTLAKGNVTFLRRGHKGGVYLKAEQLTFYRDVFASNELLSLITTQ